MDFAIFYGEAISQLPYKMRTSRLHMQRLGVQLRKMQYKPDLHRFGASLAPSGAPWPAVAKRSLAAPAFGGDWTCRVRALIGLA
jgi:hypothetical protein